MVTPFLVAPKSVPLCTTGAASALAADAAISVSAAAAAAAAYDSKLAAPALLWPKL